MADSANDHALDSTQAPAPSAEVRLAKVEALIEAHRAFDRWDNMPVPKPWPPPVWEIPPGDLQALYLERDRLQAESFRVYMAARRAS